MAGLPPPKDALTALLAADPVLCQQLETKVLRFSASQRKLLPEAVQEDLSQVDRGSPHVPHSTPPAAPPKPHASQGPSSTKISETIWSNEERSLYVQKLLQSAGQSGQPEMGNAVARFLEDLLAEISAPQPWVMLRSSRGRVFFCNMITRQTTWDHPHEGSLLEAATICKQLLQLDEPWRVAAQKEMSKALTKQGGSHRAQVNLISHLMEVVEPCQNLDLSPRALTRSDFNAAV
ncbi:unnamed protein product [Symbiodinium natans]|uniref:WW domain-containing protein n=1 Tax=Symbiodinium natans TaxID=878477 RepID=A0A812PKC6_9DINO|nr:unnamed protein product [Symbiodinium natans]